MNHPNVILIIADQWRGDCLGIAGHPDVKTPYLDTMASRGIFFEKCYSATPTCIPARAALYTGMSQDNHRRVGYLDGVRWDYPNTLASTLSDAGYQCHCAGKLHVHPLRNSIGYHSVDLHDGFLHYYRRHDTPYYENQKIADDYQYWLKQQLGVDADPTETGVECNSWTGRPWIYDEKYHPTRWVTDRGLDFLRKRDHDKPFFLTLSYVRPHPPFDAPEPFWEMYRNKKLAPPKSGDWNDLLRLEQSGHIFDSETGPIDPDLQNTARTGYYAAMTQIDFEIGRLHDSMFSHGLDASNTVLIFVSDHGEMLCDHGLFRKSLPFEGSARVPLIISASTALLKQAGFTGNRSETSGKLAELRDIMPTILALCGIDIPVTVDGCNLFSGDNEYIHGEHLYGGESCQWIVTDHDKFVWFSGSDKRMYFDLEKDPNETHNAVNDKQYLSRVNSLEQCLINELSWREEGFIQNGKLTPGKSCNALLTHSKHDRI